MKTNKASIIKLPLENMFSWRGVTMKPYSSVNKTRTELLLLEDIEPLPETSSLKVVINNPTERSPVHTFNVVEYGQTLSEGKGQLYHHIKIREVQRKDSIRSNRSIYSGSQAFAFEERSIPIRKRLVGEKKMYKNMEKNQGSIDANPIENISASPFSKEREKRRTAFFFLKRLANGLKRKDKARDKKAANRGSETPSNLSEADEEQRSISSWTYHDKKFCSQEEEEEFQGEESPQLTSDQDAHQNLIQEIKIMGLCKAEYVPECDPNPENCNNFSGEGDDATASSLYYKPRRISIQDITRNLTALAENFRSEVNSPTDSPPLDSKTKENPSRITLLEKYISPSTESSSLLNRFFPRQRRFSSFEGSGDSLSSTPTSYTGSFTREVNANFSYFTEKQTVDDLSRSALRLLPCEKEQNERRLFQRKSTYLGEIEEVEHMEDGFAASAENSFTSLLPSVLVLKREDSSFTNTSQYDEEDYYNTVVKDRQDTTKFRGLHSY